MCDADAMKPRLKEKKKKKKKENESSTDYSVLALINIKGTEPREVLTGLEWIEELGIQ